MNATNKCRTSVNYSIRWNIYRHLLVYEQFCSSFLQKNERMEQTPVPRESFIHIESFFSLVRKKIGGNFIFAAIMIITSLNCELLIFFFLFIKQV